MTETLLETVEAGVRDERARYSIIWMHGLGADGHDFEPIVPELRLPAEVPVRFVFPHAPVRPVTLNGGMAMRAWYDIVTLGGGAPQDAEGIKASAAAIEALIEREAERGVPPERLVLAGFSQGGAIALHVALRYPRRLAGIMGLSTYLPLEERLESERHESNHGTPVFLAHGEMDPVLDISLGRRARETLERMGYPVEWHQYPMVHQVCLEEIEAVSQWLQRTLPRSGNQP